MTLRSEFRKTKTASITRNYQKREARHSGPACREDYPSLQATLFHFLGIILPMAAVLRLAHLQQKSFWLDEWYSIGVAQLNWPTFFKVIVNREANMVLYYALLRFWVRFGENEVFLMIPSVLFRVGNSVCRFPPRRSPIWQAGWPYRGLSTRSKRFSHQVLTGSA